MLTRHGILNRRRAASHENSKPAWVSQPHGPQISIGDSGRIQDQRRPTPNTIRIVTASHDPGYHRWLIGAIGKAPLAVLPAWSSAAALRTALHLRTAVVLFDDDLPGSDWRPFLKALDDMDTPPALIVTSRHADERLWAEVLIWAHLICCQSPLIWMKPPA